MTLAEASSKTLELTVKNEVGLFSKSRKLMGTTLIDLSQYDLTKATTEWLVWLFQNFYYLFCGLFLIFIFKIMKVFFNNLYLIYWWNYVFVSVELII